MFFERRVKEEQEKRRNYLVIYTDERRRRGEKTMCFSEGLYTEIDGVYFDKTDRSSLSIDKDNLE